jgi:hypothetical protein
MKQSSAGVVTEGQRIGYIRVSTVAQTSGPAETLV